MANRISKKQAVEFIRNLKSNLSDATGLIGKWGVAIALEISEETAWDYMVACNKYGVANLCGVRIEIA